MSPIGFFFGVWLYCSSFKNKFLSNFIFLQSSLEFLELWKSIFSTYIRKKNLIWLLECEKLRKIPIHFVSVKIWSAFPLHQLYDSPYHITCFSINNFFPIPCSLGNIFLLLQESSAAFYNCSDYFKYFPCELWKPLATTARPGVHQRVVLTHVCRPDPDPRESVGNCASNATEMYPNHMGAVCSVFADEDKAVAELLSW